MGLLYIGAGTDFRILDIVKDELIYVFVDSLPRTEYGTIRYRQRVQKGFIPTLKKILAEKGFRKNGHIQRMYTVERGPFFKKKYFHPGLLTFSDGTRTLYYFYSCAYPEPKNKILSELMSMCDKLFISGHEPCDNVILNMSKPIMFIGSSNTVYHPDETEPDSLFYQMTHWDDMNELVNEFYSFDAVGETLEKRDMQFFFGSK